MISAVRIAEDVSIAAHVVKNDTLLTTRFVSPDHLA